MDNIYPEGSYVIWLNQAKYGLIKTLLGRTLYPDNDWTRGRDGRPLNPYSDRLRRTARSRGEDETVPLPDSLEASGAVLLDEYWDVYKALVR